MIDNNDLPNCAHLNCLKRVAASRPFNVTALKRNQYLAALSPAPKQRPVAAEATGGKKQASSIDRKERRRQNQYQV
jgi:hypothetical protein